MVDLAEVVLHAMWAQAQAEGRQLVVDEMQVGRALTELDGYGRHCHLSPGGEGQLRVEFK